MKPLHLTLVTIITFSATSRSDAQTSYFWRAEASDGFWSNADNWWDGVQPATPAGTEILAFDNDAQTSMTNDLPVTARNQIQFNAGAAASRTINGTAVNQFVASGITAPLIRNQSGSLHTINFPILLDPDNLAVQTSSGSIALAACRTFGFFGDVSICGRA